MNSLFPNMHYWLVDHPTISNYKWIPYQTPGASPLFLMKTVITYLTLTLTFRHIPTTLLPSSTFIRLITIAHNLILSLLSLIMSIGCILSTLHQTPIDYQIWPICFPKNQTPPQGPTFFWAHVFYFSKILEFVDTLLILLSGSRARRRLSFLHVYHHSIVVVMCYLWLSESQSLFPVALVTNSSVHVVMYGYYLLCALGIRPAWKRVVTDCQIVQFVFSFVISGVMLWYHFFSNGSGCEGIKGWCFNAVFNASLLALFVNFHFKNYANKKKGNMVQFEAQIKDKTN